MERKYCEKCGILLGLTTKGSLCNKHRDRAGINNPFYGKTHSKETIDKAKIKCKTSSEKLWKDPLYREKVIKAISKPRPKSFKDEQSLRIKQWYQNNPEQKYFRSKSMKKNWSEGKIKPNSCAIHNSTSKQEAKFFSDIKSIFGDYAIKKSLRLGKKWIIPDVLLKDIHYVIEYYGDFWHANPEKYKANDIIYFKTAKEVWDRDAYRIKLLKEAGYEVIIVWDSDYKKNKEKILNNLSYLLWDSCIF